MEPTIESADPVETRQAPRMHPVLGMVGDQPLRLDLARLVDTRMFIQGVSGSGKSRTLRRILEQSHGVVQQIIFDPEDELVSLADQFSYLVFSPDADVGHIRVDDAESVADMIFRSGRSAILAIGEFEPEEMQEFVGRFVNRLMAQPKATWHHVLVVADEAHLFAPQGEAASSRKAMLNLAARARKRGLCPIAATQRMSQVHKGLLAHLNNLLIGQTTLEVDIKRAADMLGMEMAEARRVLPDLAPGEFLAFGPATSQRLVKVKVGDTVTKHGSLGALGEHGFEPLIDGAQVLELLQGMSASSRRAAEEVAAAKEGKQGKTSGDAEAGKQPAAGAEKLRDRIAAARLGALRPLLAADGRGYGAVRKRAEELSLSEKALHRWLRAYNPFEGLATLRPVRLRGYAEDELQRLEQRLKREDASEPMSEKAAVEA